MLKYKRFIVIGVIILIAISAMLLVENAREKTAKDYLLAENNGKKNTIRIVVSPRLKEALKISRASEEFKKSNKVIFITYSRGFSDHFAAVKIQAAAQNLGWEAVVIGNLNNDKAYDINYKIGEYLKPDFVITLHAIPLIKSIPHYLILHFPDPWFENPVRDNAHEHMFNYEGFLLSFGDDRFAENLTKYFAANNKVFNYEKFYFSVPGNDVAFRKLNYNRLFFCGARWDDRRGGAEYSTLYKLLDHAGYFDAYGPKRPWRDVPGSYRGLLPFDHNIISAKIRESGIGLVLHSQEHYNQNIPSTRMFEFAAASAVMISENMKFMQDNFGDNVLYVDPSLPAEDLFKQIDKHVRWIQANPEKAGKMAYNSNKIFQEKFVLEKLLLKVEKMHNRLQSTGVKPEK